MHLYLPIVAIALKKEKEKKKKQLGLQKKIKTSQFKTTILNVKGFLPDWGNHASNGKETLAALYLLSPFVDY